MNHYDNHQHEALAAEIGKIKHMHWIISYDDTPEIEKVYKRIPEARRKKYALNHAAYRARNGQEILFFSKALRLPDFSHEQVGKGIRFGV